VPCVTRFVAMCRFFVILTHMVNRGTLHLMDLDDLFAKRPGDPLVLMTRQDLDPFSVEELLERIAVLEVEIVRVRAKCEGAVNHRASADALFKS
jgi:uncharacterized small protein (DUF1192 family)